MPPIADLAFTAYLLFLLPARQLWQSMRARPPEPGPAPHPMAEDRFARNAGFAGLPLLALSALFIWSGRHPSLLGLAMPVSTLGLWLIAAVCVLLVGIVIGTVIWERGLDETKAAAHRAKVRQTEVLPGSRTACLKSLLLIVLIGPGWELLYRGYLMLVLTPLVGTAGAVVLAALAYGLAHGYYNWKQLGASLVSALLFTLAYVVTGSLWWLIVLHAGLPMMAMLSAHLTLSAPQTAKP